MGPRIKTTKKRRDLTRRDDNGDNSNGDNINNNNNNNNNNSNNNSNLSHSQATRDHNYVGPCIPRLTKPIDRQGPTPPSRPKAIPMPWHEPVTSDFDVLYESHPVALHNSNSTSGPDTKSNSCQEPNSNHKLDHISSAIKPAPVTNSNLAELKPELKSDAGSTLETESVVGSDPAAASFKASPFIKPALNLKSPASNSPIPHINASPNHMPPPSPGFQSNHKDNHRTYYSYKDFRSTFTWETYLKLLPAPVAPKEAFRQAIELPKNQFTAGMKLEALDPRNSCWALATVIFTEGLHLRLRFMGGDDKNDLYEIIDSDNIRAVGSNPSELLLAPTGFTGNIAFYPKYVEKVLRDEKTIIAPPEFFPKKPNRPPRNLFKIGMKLEAVDRKNRDFICPATVAEVNGDKIRISFDGWRGSFDYVCDYYSRDIFPVNWCKEVGRPIQPPHGWESVLSGGNLPSWTPPQSPGQAQSASTSPPTRKASRGRPKKDIIKETSKSPRESNSTGHRVKTTSKPARGRPPSSTSSPKKQPTPADTKQESFRLESPQSPDDESVTMMDIPNDEPNIHRFQCQRTISYAEWQDMKQLETQMPRSYSSDDLSEMTDAGMNSSEVASSCPTESESHEPSHKKVKTGTSIPPDLRDILVGKPKTLERWTVQDVLDVLGTETSLAKYKETFHENEIDGKAFGLFDAKKRDLLMSMGLKLGPVLKVLNLREQVELYLGGK